jgi:signal transduction histidine kinase
MIAGVALLVLTVADYDYLDRRLAGALSFVAVWPWLAYVVTPAIVSSVGVETIISLNASGYTLSLAAVWFAVTRGGIFDAAPAAGTLGPETVLADLDDAVVVVDRDERIVTLNDAAADAFGVEPAAATAEPLSACVGFDLDTLRDSDTVERSGPDGSRQFEATVSPVSDQFDRQPGYAIVFTDVTQQRVRSQRLSVLNRVLRHNLRNEMNKIRGRAELIADGGQEYVDHAETIVSSADDLIATGERARQVEQMMATTAAVEEAASLATIADTVVDEYRSEYPDATLSVDIDDALTAPVNEQVLAHILDNLVENAVVHNDAPTPVVTVGARATDDGVEVSVADNGPGIPNNERAVIESGDEDDLDHGSGLGLWAVKWGAVRLGGEIAFADRKPRGTVVTITLPTETSADPATAATAAAD